MGPVPMEKLIKNGGFETALDSHITEFARLQTIRQIRAIYRSDSGVYATGDVRT